MFRRHLKKNGPPTDQRLSDACRRILINNESVCNSYSLDHSQSRGIPSQILLSYGTYGNPIIPHRHHKSHQGDSGTAHMHPAGGDTYHRT